MQEKHVPPHRRGRSFSRRRMLASTALSAAGLSIPAWLAACDSGGNTSGNTTNNANTKNTLKSSEGLFPSHPEWNFVFVNHATENPFFTPTRYGAEDASALLGCKYQWTGSVVNKVSEMVDAINAAIAAKVDGIAVSIIDSEAFDDPVRNALDAGIPVVTYNADVPAGSTNERLAYIGQDLFQSGVQMGQRIIDLVPSGDVVGFIATPGSLNIQPRIEGTRQAIHSSGKPINFIEIVTGATVNEELPAVEAYYLDHPHIKGMFAFDGGSTQSVGQIMEKYALTSKGIHGGGYDLLAGTLTEINKGNLDFTIDQQPYLQGFLPIVQLFLYKISGGLLQPSNSNISLLFVTKNNVGPYLNTQTRFEGSSSQEKVISP